MIDSNGFRHNVGIILCNPSGELFWARRVGRDVWQFPQGGILPHESHVQAMFRELAEETGLSDKHVEIVGQTRNWLRYRLPRRMIRYDQQPLCVGQKQIWFMLRLIGSDEDVCLNASEMPEFDHWKWVSYWYPLQQVAPFKRNVYKRALSEFAPMLGAAPLAPATVL